MAETLRRRSLIAVVACIVAMPLCGVSRATAQQLFSQEATLEAPFPYDDQIGVRVAVSGNTALASMAGPASHECPTAVFDRHPESNTWNLVTVLSPPTPLFSYPCAFAIDGDTAILGTGEAAYVHQRDKGGPNVWGLVATLVVADTLDGTFGRDVAISGDTAIVGVPGPAPLSCTPSFDSHCTGTRDLVPGFAFVYRRDQGGINKWGQVAALTAGVGGNGYGDFFGGSVSINRETIVVGAVKPFPYTESPSNIGPNGLPIRPTIISSGIAYLFERNTGGPNAWGRVVALSLNEPTHDGAVVPSVSIDRDTVVVGSSVRTLPPPNIGSSGRWSNAAHVFERNYGGPHGGAWGKAAVIVPPSGGEFGPDFKASISGNLIAIFSQAPPANEHAVNVYARNQGGVNRWGHVAAVGAHSDAAFVPQPHGLSMDGDTLLAGDVWGVPDPFIGFEWTGEVAIFVADVDGDGLRDAIDPCPRDPQNNVAAKCRRSPADVVDALLSASAPSQSWVNGDFAITVTFTNRSLSAIRNPFFQVTQLSGGNVLKNADGGTGGVGATLSPDVGNGVLEAGESMTVTFVIGLATRGQFRFHVNAQGNPE